MPLAMLRALLPACLLLLGLAGCALGPQTMPSNRMDYNIAAQRSTNEQVLLNLVRMKYMEAPLFMQLGAIASSYHYSASTGLTLGLRPENYSFPFSGTYTEAPTVTYTPYDGQKYIQEILAEIDILRFIMLYRSGMNMELLMRLMVDRIGTAQNSWSKTYHLEQTYENFVQLTSVFVRKQTQGDLEFVNLSQGKDKPNISLLVVRCISEEEANSIAALMGIKTRFKRSRDTGQIIMPMNLLASSDLGLEVNIDPRFENLHFRLRNCREVLDYLAQGVEAPPEHARQKVVKTFAMPGGDNVDGRKFVGDLMNIRSAKERPEGAYTAVQYRGYWYYVDDSDARTKEALSFLITLLALQSGNPPTNTPFLTLPVGGGN
jgi:hypothetical protein